VQGRGGKGLITMNCTKRTGSLVAIKGVRNDEDLMIITENGIMIRTSVDQISTMGRNTQGVRVINLKDGDSIADVTRVVIEDEPDVAEDAEGSEDAADDAASDAVAHAQGNGAADEATDPTSETDLDEASDEAASNGQME